MDNKYQKGKIYKIIDTGYKNCYYGSTVESLSKRMSHHRKDYASFKDHKARYVSVYSMFDEHGLEHCKIELVEEFPCDSKEQLRQREGWYIQNNVCVNKKVAGRTEREYKEQNKDQILERKKVYREQNQDKIKEYRERTKGRRTELILCPICNCNIQRCCLSKHERTIRHQKNACASEEG
jgi:adenylate kinase family enzyme